MLSTLLDSIRGIFTTQSNFYDEALSRKQLTDKGHSLISQKTSILEVRLGCKYALSIELFLCRFGQSKKFHKKSKKKIRDIQQMTTHCLKDVFWRSSKRRPGNVLATSRINLPGTFLGHQTRTSSVRHFRTFPGRQIETSPGWSNRIFRGHPRDVGGGRPRNILGTNICFLGLWWKD